MKTSAGTIKNVLLMIFVIILSIVLGLLLIIGSHLYVSQYDYEIMSSTAETFKQYEGLRYKFFGRWMDPFSDAVITEIVTYLGPENALDKSIKGLRIDSLWGENIDEYPSLNTLEGAQNAISEKLEYKQYWHGYQVFLRPLFSFLNYTQVKVVNAFVQAILLFATLAVIYKYKKRMLVPFIVFILFISPIAVANCIHYYPVYYITLLAVLAFCVMSRNGRVDNWRLYYLCLFSGMATAYCDLLTSPLVSLAAIMCLSISDDQTNCVQAKDCLARIIKIAILWGIGYVVFWCGKWIILVFYEGPQYLTELMIHLTERSSSKVDALTISRVDAVLKNLLVLFADLKVSIVSFIAFVYLFVRDIKTAKSGTAINKQYLAIYCIPVLMCIIFMIITANHAYIHKFFAYRTLTPCVLCGFAAVENAFEGDNSSSINYM